MAITINTRSAKYQNYLSGLASLRVDAMPRLKQFSKLSTAKQIWWLQRDPLMRKLIKFALLMNKHIPLQLIEDELKND